MSYYSPPELEPPYGCYWKIALNDKVMRSRITGCIMQWMNDEEEEEKEDYDNICITQSGACYVGGIEERNWTGSRC